MNELFFFLHVLILLSLVLISLKTSKEALIACFVLETILANLFATKQMECFGLTITCTDVYTIGALFSLNLMQEYFGKTFAKKVIWASFFGSIFFIVMAFFHLSYIPSPFDQTHTFFSKILSTTPRILGASLIVSLITQKVDVELFSFLKKREKKVPFLSPFLLATLFSQFLDTCLFSLLGLYGIAHSIISIILMSYLIKVVITFLAAPFIIFSRKVVT